MNFNKRFFLHVIPVRVVVSWWKPGNLIFEKRSYSCYWKLIFWLVETIYFLPFSDTPATDSFIFPSSGNVFLNNSCISVSGNGFSGQWKPFFIYFLDIPPSDSFFFSFFFLVFFFFHSGWWKRIF